VFTCLKTGEGLDRVINFIETQGLLPWASPDEVTVKQRLP
jgi:hypothetical protein